MKEENEITIYKIFDMGDNNYSSWYGEAIEIEKYLEENKDNISKYNEEDSWVDNLMKYGLTYKEIWSNRL